LLLHRGAALVELGEEPRKRSGAPCSLERLRVGGDSRPLGRNRGRDLEVKLQSVGRPDPEGLVRVRGRTGEKHGAVREVESVAVPLERGKRVGQRREHGVGPSLVGERHRENTHLRNWSPIDACPEAGGKKLRAETDAEVGNACSDSGTNGCLLVGEPGEVGVVVDAHRAAHRDDQVVAAPIRKRLTLIELDPVDRGPPLAKGIFVCPRRLAGDVLENEAAHLPILAPSEC
jgi:hypothetical protein